jgi:hypothetical protein
LGNTTSPPEKQINITSPPSQLPLFIAEIYELIFPHVCCPPSLFQDIISINYLRSQTKNLCISVDSARAEAKELLARIELFSPEDWAQPNSFHTEWLLIGNIFQSSIAIYCICSLQSLSVIPNTPYFEVIRASHTDRLFFCLKAALVSRHVKKFVMWPLVVAGTQVMTKDIHERDWINQQFTECSRDYGSSSLLKARTVLEKMWKKGKKDWDVCWNQPNAFVL